MISVIITVAKSKKATPKDCACFIFDNDYKQGKALEKRISKISDNVRRRHIYVNVSDLDIQESFNKLVDLGFMPGHILEDCGVISKCNDLHDFFNVYTRHYDSKHHKFYTISDYDFMNAYLFLMGDDSVVIKEQEIPF